MKKVAIIMPISDRNKLLKQAVDSLNDNTTIPFELYTKYGMEDGEVATVNYLIKNIGKKYDYIVRSGDDIFYSKGWLVKMLGIMERNRDIKLLGGCRYPTARILEEKKDHYIVETSSGTNTLMSRETWDEFGPIAESKEGLLEDAAFSKKIRDAGWKVANLKDNTLVVHCGLSGARGTTGRSKMVNEYLINLANKVRAIYE